MANVPWPPRSCSGSAYSAHRARRSPSSPLLSGATLMVRGLPPAFVLRLGRRFRVAELYEHPVYVEVRAATGDFAICAEVVDLAERKRDRAIG
jgi:hypothetical protein